MHEGAGQRAWTAVEVFVAAPGGEVRVAVMQCQRRIADGMREVEAADGTSPLCGTDDPWQVEGLAGAVLHTRPQYQRDLCTAAREYFFELRDVDEVLAGQW